VSFKTCSCCKTVWNDRDAFLSDPLIVLSGYQANFSIVESGFFLFTHSTVNCGTTMAVETQGFVDLYDGPVFQQSLVDSEHCQGYCHDSANIETECSNSCECAFVRNIMQILRRWPKR